jgi:hypothetical protein
MNLATMIGPPEPVALKGTLVYDAAKYLQLQLCQHSTVEGKLSVLRKHLFGGDDLRLRTLEVFGVSTCIRDFVEWVSAVEIEVNWDWWEIGGKFLMGTDYSVLFIWDKSIRVRTGLYLTKYEFYKLLLGEI